MYGKKLRELRNIEGWTQEEVAKKLGVSKQTYSHYENEKRRPGLDIIRELAAVYRVNIDDIFAEEPVSNIAYLPIVGSISCGDGVFAYEDIESYETIAKDWVKGGEYFFLRAKGDSMIGARIQEGDLLLIRKQPSVENGEIAAVLVEEDTLLKRVYKHNGQLVLQSENPDYPPIFVPPTDARIIGKLKKVVISFYEGF